MLNGVKSDTKGQIGHDTIYVRNLKLSNSPKQRAEWCLPEAVGREQEGNGQRYKVLVSPGGLLYRMVPIVKNTVLSSSKFAARVDIMSCFYHMRS